MNQFLAQLKEIDELKVENNKLYMAGKILRNLHH